METWKKHLKDYEIIEWNEKNFDIDSNKFVKEAYEAAVAHTPATGSVFVGGSTFVVADLLKVL